MLAHVTPVHRSAEVVHDPVCAEALDALVGIARERELEVPLVKPRIDFVRLVLESAVCRKQVQGFVEKALLAQNWLRCYCVRCAPSEGKLARLVEMSSKVPPYETFRMPFSVILMLFTDMDSGFVRTSFPVSSVAGDSEGSP